MFALHMVHGMFPNMFKEDVSVVVGDFANDMLYSYTYVFLVKVD